MEDKSFFLLIIFLFFVLLIAFIVPQLNFGRLYGTDGYSHLFHTDVMASSKGLSEFYEKAGSQVSNPSSDINAYNSPFGLWLFGATIAKLTGIPPITAELLFVIVFLFIILGSFYLYSGLMLKLKEQKILACLFMLSMPFTVTTLLSYRSGIFVIPFLFIVLFIALKEPVQWKLLPIAWVSIFILIISHTGTFVFLIGFSIAFFLIYCLLWGKFLQPLYISILSTLVIYIISLQWFPEMKYPYTYTSSSLLSPGEFLATKFNFPLPGDLVKIFYSNLLVEQNIVYVVILCALLYTVGYFLIYIHKKTAAFLLKRENYYAFALPVQNISHSFIATPIWTGPVHVLFSIVGVFQLDDKGKCILITSLLAGLLPDILKSSQGIVVATGALREIWYLVIIIPITATLGFWHIIGYLNDPSSKTKKYSSYALWIVVCVSIVVTPVVGIIYYLPTISGEDYVIGGLKWLGDNGDHYEKVAGYSLRPVPIYTNMTDVSYDLPSPTDRILIRTLRDIFFISGNQIYLVDELRKSFGVKYILSSDRILENLGGSQEDLRIDTTSALNKIYASNDFGIYEISTVSDNRAPIPYRVDNISFKKMGGTYEIDSGYYKVILSENNPVLQRFGTSQHNFFGNGYFNEKIKISGTELSSDGDIFNLEDIGFTSEISDNQIIYRTELQNPQTNINEGTLFVRYTFYPNVIKREYRLSNDWFVAQYSPQFDVQYSINIYSPMSQFSIKNDKTQLEKQIIAFQDAVTRNIEIEDFYLSDGQNGMVISFAASSPQPSSVSYTGATGYNKSHVGITQYNSIKPGASFLSTQFLSLGSETYAKKNIQTREGIELINYPDGITPILVSGYSNLQSDSFMNEKITMGDAVLSNNSIPYGKVIIPSILIENTTNDQNVTIIGSLKTRAGAYFDDYPTQETNIRVFTDYIKEQGVSYIGFMPDSFYYNLDTVDILSKNNISFIFSGQVNSAAKGYRNPQIAYITGEPAGVVLFPVSSPSSNTLLSSINKDIIFQGWENTFNAAVDNDEIVILSIRSQDIGDPSYTKDFVQLFSYAREKGLTFSSHTRIADHYKLIQNISYSGLIEGDTASLKVTNTNPVTVQNVTFKVTLPALSDGDYRVNDGKIVRTKPGNGQSVVYISIEVPADSTKNIIIEPDIQRKTFQVVIPQQPIIEGSNEISVRDKEGNPLRNVDVIIDSSYHQTDENGLVRMNILRGYHKITVQSPGYEKYSTEFTVRGRLFIVEQAINSIFNR